MYGPLNVKLYTYVNYTDKIFFMLVPVRLLAIQMGTLCTTLVKKGDCSCLFAFAEFTKAIFSSGELIEYVECNKWNIKSISSEMANQVCF
jgi:hypothetical protein